MASPPQYTPTRRPKRTQDLPFAAGDYGMRVELSAIKGLTDKNVLAHPYRFQVPPTDTFAQEWGFGYNDYDTLRAGQHSRPTGVQLTTVRFSTLVLDFPATWAVWPSRSRVDPLEQYERDQLFNVLLVTHDLYSIMASGTPLRLKAGQTELWDDWDVNLSVTLRTVKVEERSGEVDTRYLDLEFHEYRQLHVDQKKAQKKGKGYTPTRILVDRHGAVHDVHGNKRIAKTPGRLYQVAQYFYGDPSEWKSIVKANPLLRKLNWSGSRSLASLVMNFNQGRTIKLRVPRV